MESYNILIIEKNEDEYSGDYGNIERTIKSHNRLLSRWGHQVKIITDLEEVTDEIYSSADCVIAHTSKIERLKELHKCYPKVALIITTGDGREEDEYNQLFRDGTGTYVLAKPYEGTTLKESIRRVTSETKKSV